MSRLVTVRFCMYERRTPAVSIHRDQTSCDEYWSSETAGSALMERRVGFTAVSKAAVGSVGVSLRLPILNPEYYAALGLVSKYQCPRATTLVRLHLYA